MTAPDARRAIPRALEGRLLALNNAHATELSSLDAAGFRVLLDGAFHARCAGDGDALLIALDQAHPDYASPNYLWFRARFPRFVYVDRVVVAPSARRACTSRVQDSNSTKPWKIRRTSAASASFTTSFLSRTS